MSGPGWMARKNLPPPLSLKSVKLFPQIRFHFVIIITLVSPSATNHHLFSHRIKVTGVGVTPSPLENSPGMTLLNRNCRTVIGLVVNKPRFVKREKRTCIYHPLTLLLLHSAHL